MPNGFNDDSFTDAEAEALRRTLGAELPQSQPVAHQRTGHLTHEPLTAREQSAVAGVEALRHPDLDDGIDHT